MHKDFKFMLERYSYNLHPGDIVAGKILYKETKGFIVNIGDQVAGYLPMEEISLTFQYSIDNNLFINMTREFFILTYNKTKKQLILSIKRLEYMQSWKRIKQIQKENIVFNLPITALNKGGIITYLENIQSFIPNSHISINNYSYKNTKNVMCKLLITDEKNNQIILSNKSAILQSSKHKFCIGEIAYGKIIQIKQYGLFLELNKILALMHISEIGSNYISNLYQTFSIEQIIKVQIIHIDFKQGRLSLSKKLIINHHQQ
uniref:30S ribosomal protein S1 n=1 Tax=Campylaephora sungminbooi TaxID=1896769 RepID=A0A1B0TI20_9FLOR|nr:30S ribosomal protein S1 [Campylaephora sungminbooi]AKU47371.1 30S ribosomal protein S1 [Campylaephora sungminbooi]ALN11818.1 30S ribosomal protein S1 [Campylaephora sungminbooi]